MEAAWAEAVSVWSRESRPSSMASNTKHKVITLVMEAQGRTSWEFFSNSTRPVDASMSTPDGAVMASSSAWTENPCTANATAKMAVNTNTRSFFIGTILSLHLQKGYALRWGKRRENKKIRPPYQVDGFPYACCFFTRK